MQNAGMPGQIPSGLYGANFGMTGMNGSDGGAASDFVAATTDKKHHMPSQTTKDKERRKAREQEDKGGSRQERRITSDGLLHLIVHLLCFLLPMKVLP